MTGTTLFAKIWDSHVVRVEPDAAAAASDCTRLLGSATMQGER